MHYSIRMFFFCYSLLFFNPAFSEELIDITGIYQNNNGNSDYITINRQGNTYIIITHRADDTGYMSTMIVRVARVAVGILLALVVSVIAMASARASPNAGAIRSCNCARVMSGVAKY